MGHVTQKAFRYKEPVRPRFGVPAPRAFEAKGMVEHWEMIFRDHFPLDSCQADAKGEARETTEGWEMNEKDEEDWQSRFTQENDSEGRLAFRTAVTWAYLETCKSLRDNYLMVVKEVRQDKESSFDEKLRKVARAFYQHYEFADPLALSTRSNRELYKFIVEDVDLRTDLDSTNLRKDGDKYSIRCFLPYLQPYTTIYVDDFAGIRNLETTLHALYKKWLPRLDQTNFIRKDLLTQILVVYTIKRALNGDEKAITQLWTLFKDTANSIAIRMSMRRGLGVYVDDIKQEALILLRYLISGFSPEFIFDSLLGKNNPEILPIPKWIKKFYYYYLTDYVPKQLNDMRNVFFHPIFQDPYSPINWLTEWRGTPKRVNKFNSYCFIPTKKSNLTTWLFGTKRNPMQGRYLQHLSDVILKRYEKQHREVIRVASELRDDPKEIGSFTHVKSLEEPLHELLDARKCKETALTEARGLDEKPIDEAIQKLVDMGTTRRNAEIFIRNKMEKIPQTNLAQDYSLSRRQIIRICKKISAQLHH